MSQEVHRVDASDPQRLMAVMQFLSELGQVVASNTDLQPILDWIVSKTTGMMAADEGSIRLIEPNDEQTGRTIIRREPAGHASGSWPRAVALSVTGFLLQDGDHLASSDLLADPRFAGLRGVETRVRSILAVPLKVENRITGVLAVTQAQPGRQWSGTDVQLLSIVAGNSAGVIEQARLRARELEMQRLEEEQRRLEEERRRLERELKAAREIQMSLVPGRPLRAGGWEITGRVVPALQVGGDGFDYFSVEGGRLGFAIADVMGKGFPAAMLMASVQATLRATCDGRQEVAEAVRHINQSVTRAESGKFVTLFYGELDVATGQLRYTNAGHNYPWLLRGDGTIEELREGGKPLGLFENADYEQGLTRLDRRDALLLYSDGIPDAKVGDQEFGEERLNALWREFGTRPPAEFIDRVLGEVERFRGTAPQNDDMTMVVLSAQPAN